MIHPHTELRDAGRDIGLGVFATRRIPRGTIVWAQDPLDLQLPLSRVRGFPLRYRRLLDHYGFLDATGTRIVCWDIGRFVNHSCIPNVLPTPWKLEIAVRTIHAGEQITNDYATLNLEKRFRCGCGLAECRGLVRPGDFEGLVAAWDARVREALPASSRANQPLMEWLDGPRRRAFRRCSAHPDEMPSIVGNRLEAARSDPRAFAAVAGRRRAGRVVALDPASLDAGFALPDPASNSAEIPLPDCVTSATGAILPLAMLEGKPRDAA